MVVDYVEDAIIQWEINSLYKMSEYLFALLPWQQCHRIQLIGLLFGHHVVR